MKKKKHIPLLFHFYEVVEQKKLIYGASSLEGQGIGWEGPRGKVLSAGSVYFDECVSHSGVCSLSNSVT